MPKASEIFGSPGGGGGAEIVEWDAAPSASEPVQHSIVGASYAGGTLTEPETVKVPETVMLEAP